MMSAIEGGGGLGKAAVVREVSKGCENADKGGGGKKILKFCRHHKWKAPK